MEKIHIYCTAQIQIGAQPLRTYLRKSCGDSSNDDLPDRVLESYAFHGIIVAKGLELL